MLQKFHEKSNKETWQLIYLLHYTLHTHKTLQLCMHFTLHLHTKKGKTLHTPTPHRYKERQVSMTVNLCEILKSLMQCMCALLWISECYITFIITTLDFSCSSFIFHKKPTNYNISLWRIVKIWTREREKRRCCSLFGLKLKLYSTILANSINVKPNKIANPFKQPRKETLHIMVMCRRLYGKTPKIYTHLKYIWETKYYFLC